MAELEQQLNAILSDPSAMEQIFSLAQSITGGTPGQPPPSASPPARQDAESPPPSFDLSGLSAVIQGLTGGGGGTGGAMDLLKDLDPHVIEKAISLYSSYGAADEQRLALLSALRPFLKEERRGQLDRAIQIARFSRLARVGLALWKEQGDTSHV